MVEVDIKIRTASIADRSRLANLIHFGTYVHRHLDWKSPLDWIGYKPYLVEENNSGIIAALACPPEIPAIAWIRLFAVGSEVPVKVAWQVLWQAAKEQLNDFGAGRVAAIALQSWFSELLEESGFNYTHNVVVLIWEKQTLTPQPNALETTIRPMTFEDLDIVQEIDQSAFSLEWQNSRDSLELAFIQASLATIAERDDEIVGYQISTSSPLGAHLARLAVRNNMQGRGIGYYLVSDLINRLQLRGVTQITVNTQQNNVSSLALYAKAGFKITGETYQVYQYFAGE
jgi:ribosomal protein S18 acetylase RimI-like enzyme